MSLLTAYQRPVAAEGEYNNFAVSFIGVLDDGELLTGTPTVEEQDTSDLTIVCETVSTTVLTINGVSVPAGKAVQFRVDGQLVANSIYTLKITVNTNSVPCQVKVRCVKFRVENC